PWKTPARTLPRTSSGPRVAGLVHSAAVTNAAPTTIRTALADRVILVCRLQERGRQRARVSSRITGNPMPPTITAAVTGREIHGSVTKPERLSLNSANPALLNADTAWNAPSHRAWPRSSP